MDTSSVIVSSKIATKPFPLELLGKNWRLDPIKSKTNLSELMEFDFSSLQFVDCLLAGETAIICSHKRGRLRIKELIPCGASIFYAILLVYRANKGCSVLDQLYQKRGITHIDFPADVFVRPGKGDRVILVLYRRSDGVWDWSYKKLTAICSSVHVSAVLPKRYV